MQLITPEKKPDILVTAREGYPVLLVEVKRRALNQVARRQIAEYSEYVKADFVMGIDPQRIIVAPTRNGVPDWQQAITLPTMDILRQYSDLQTLDQIEAFYLEGLVEAWLQDLLFHGSQSIHPDIPNLIALD